MEVYREVLPESYLLILTNDESESAGGTLVRALRRASRSGKTSVWVDCSYLKQLPAKIITLLLHYHCLLRRRNIHLVLCHLPATAEKAFAALAPATCPPIVATLLDADHYCHTHQLPEENLAGAQTTY